MSTIPADEYEYEYSSETHQIYSFGQMCKLSHGLTTYTERKKKRRVEFFPSYFNHFLRCLL